MSDFHIQRYQQQNMTTNAAGQWCRYEDALRAVGAWEVRAKVAEEKLRRIREEIAQHELETPKSFTTAGVTAMLKVLVNVDRIIRQKEYVE
jgi:hypothetical protein